MTQEEQRIAIAQSCGWTRFTPDTIQYTAQRSDGKWDLIPDYLNDLNAMHQAEMTLKAEDHHAYGCYCSNLYEDYGNTVSLTASQRAEAFLRTLNLYTDTK